MAHILRSRLILENGLSILPLILLHGQFLQYLHQTILDLGH